jgi:hypothetical protein
MQLEIVNAGNQVKTESVSLASIAVFLCDNPEALEHPYDLLIDDPFTGNSPVGPFLFFREGMLLAAFLRKCAVGMQLVDALVASIRLDLGLRVKADLGLFEQAEVMSSSVSKIRADHLFGALVDNDLALDGVAFFLARVGTFLSFFGRCTGASEASIRTTSYSTSLLSRLLRPGKAKRLSLMSVSSTQRMIL